MKNLPIGIFDSGFGGLTAYREIKSIMPGADYIYFGDSARIPYGTKSPEVIKKFSLQNTRFLLSEGVCAVLVACGSASTNALEDIKSSCTIPVIGVIDSPVKRLVEIAQSGNGTAAILGTSATIRSGGYERAVRALNPDIRVISRACPMFVSLVENGYTSPDSEVSYLFAKEYLSDIAAEKPDAVLLGCTHYPLLSGVISKVIPEAVQVNTGKEAALEMCSLLGNAAAKAGGTTAFYTSDDPELFSEGAEKILGYSIAGRVRRIDIEKY